MKKTLNNIGISALVIIVFVACALFSTLCSSCQSQSGKLDKIQPEKVVVLDMFIKMNGEPYKYRVNRIEKGVIDIVYDVRLFEAGDTIYHRYLPGQ